MTNDLDPPFDLTGRKKWNSQREPSCSVKGTLQKLIEVLSSSSGIGLRTGGNRIDPNCPTHWLVDGNRGIASTI